MDDFIIVIKSDPKVKTKIKDMLDKYFKSSLKYQSKIGYDTLIQKDVLKDMINPMGAKKVDIEKEVKMKIFRLKDLEKKFSITFRLSRKKFSKQNILFSKFKTF